MSGYTISVNMPTGKMIDSDLTKEGEEPILVPEFKEISIRLSEPTFEQYGGAMMALQTPSGAQATLAAGDFILTCCIHNDDRDNLELIKKNVKAHVAVAQDAYTLLGVFKSEVKKN